MMQVHPGQVHTFILWFPHFDNFPAFRGQSPVMFLHRVLSAKIITTLIFPSRPRSRDTKLKNKEAGLENQLKPVAPSLLGGCGNDPTVRLLVGPCEDKVNRMVRKLLNWRARALDEKSYPKIGRCFINLITHAVSLDLYMGCGKPSKEVRTASARRASAIL